MFDMWIEARLALTLSGGDTVILNNLAVHKSAGAAQCLAEKGAWFPPLSACGPDLDPMEMMFPKVKTLPRKLDERPAGETWRARQTLGIKFMGL